MIDWKRQGPAFVGTLALPGGEWAKVVVAAPRPHPRGAMLVRAAGPGIPPDTAPLAERLDYLTPAQVVDILCLQERAFGTAALPPLDVP